MKPRLAIVLTAAVAAACVGPHGPRRGPGPAGGERDIDRVYAGLDALLLVGFDRDGDLSVSELEIAAGAAGEFSRADANGDGGVAPLEFAAWARSALGGDGAPRRLDMDRNVDGVISAEEFVGEIAARARDYDKDANHAITRTELARERPSQGLRDRAPGGRARGREPGQDGPSRRR